MIWHIGKMDKVPKRPSNVNLLAKLMVDIAFDECEERPGKMTTPASLNRRRSRSKKGGQAQAAAFIPIQRRAIAQRAAAALWNRDDS